MITNAGIPSPSERPRIKPKLLESPKYENKPNSHTKQTPGYSPGGPAVISSLATVVVVGDCVIVELGGGGLVGSTSEQIHSSHSYFLLLSYSPSQCRSNTSILSSAK
jgi:hypothetical protein